MNLPRDFSGARLIKALSKQEHVPIRQAGSLTVPLHDPLRSGTLAALVSDVAAHHGLTREEVLSILSK